jgi:WD40 repeat protein
MCLVGGLTNGTVCLWQLSTATWGSDAVEAKHAWTVYQDTSFIHEGSMPPAVTRVKMSPVDPALLLVGDSQGHVRVWDVHKEGVPVCHFKFHNGAITALDWDPCGQGFFHGSAENTDVCFEYLWDQPITLSRNVATDLKRTLYSHGHDHGAVWAVCAFHHGGVSGAISVASDGSVRLAPSISLFSPKRPFVLPVGELFRLHKVQLQPSVPSGLPSSSSFDCSSGVMVAEGNAEEKIGATGGTKAAREWVRCSACTSRSRLWVSDAAVKGVTDPARALRALSVASVSSLGTRSKGQAQVATAGALPVDSNLVAYSGASGLVRVQIF